MQRSKLFTVFEPYTFQILAGKHQTINTLFHPVLSNEASEGWLRTTRVAESTKYTKGTYNPIMPKKLLMLMSMNTGSLSRVTSIMAASVDLNDSGRVRQGQRSAARHTLAISVIFHLS
jgi:hypothetical protein